MHKYTARAAQAHPHPRRSRRKKFRRVQRRFPSSSVRLQAALEGAEGSGVEEPDAGLMKLEAAARFGLRNMPDAVTAPVVSEIEGSTVTRAARADAATDRACSLGSAGNGCIGHASRSSPSIEAIGLVDGRLPLLEIALLVLGKEANGYTLFGMQADPRKPRRAA
jgi:hypothetical protein